MCTDDNGVIEYYAIAVNCQSKLGDDSGLNGLVYCYYAAAVYYVFVYQLTNIGIIA